MVGGGGALSSLQPAVSHTPRPIPTHTPGALYLLFKGALYFLHSVLSSPWVVSRLVGG
jgi:hypothetical protein